MSYVDGFVIPIPKKKLRIFVRQAKLAGKVWRSHGALEFRECIADDVPFGKRTSFPRSVKLKRGETVVFSFIVYKSRAQRDKINAQIMKDARMNDPAMMKAMPFDMKRFAMGGFKVLVSR